MPAPPLLKARVTRAVKRQERQKSHAAAYRVAPHHYAAPVYRPSTLGRTAPRRAAAPRYTLPHGFRTEAPSRNVGARRAERYRTSRPYYKTFRTVWGQNPQVKRAERTAQRAYQAAALLGGERAAGVRVQGMRPIEREMRRGPDVLAGEAYDKYAKHLWKLASRYYPDSKNRPGSKLDYGPRPRERAVAWVMHNQPNVVHIAPETVRQFMAPKGFRGQAPSVLLHEWAHTRQPLGQRSRATLEGGAEAVEQLLAKRLGVPYGRSSPEYLRWAAQQRRKGKRYLLKGQYRRR